MAIYKYVGFIGKFDLTAFDQLHDPGDRTPFSGIYRCEACGHEDACNTGDPLPPENHAQHNPNQGAVKWRLTVFAYGR
ncbi:MAG: hypothetical protein DME32_02645 [Verrucomicrobia bacterium]|nr:MAG: hypothetical protein DME32_02645 [Verrucomicrobiota bacterium]